jgi:tellurite resistance protein TehA-like permease
MAPSQDTRRSRRPARARAEASARVGGSTRTLARLPKLALRAAADLFPGYFALVMATGILSIAAHDLGLSWISRPLLAVNALAYAALLGLLLLRVTRFAGRLAADLGDPARGPGFFTLVAASCVLGAQLLLVAQARAAAWALWWFGVALWWIVTYAFFTSVAVRREKPDFGQAIGGAWLIASVATNAVSVLGTLLAAGAADARPFLFATLCAFLLGGLLYLAIITLIFYRLMFLQLTAEALLPAYWINMGAVAIATLAGSTLIETAGRWRLLLELRPFLEGATLFFWAAASWWIPLLLCLTVWRHAVQRYPLRYDPRLWGMVFPLGMYTAATLHLSDTLDLPFLAAIPRGFLVVALAAWTATAAGLVSSLRRAVQAAGEPLGGESEA